MKNTRVPPPPRGLSASSAGWWRKIVAEFELSDASLLVLQAALESRDRMLAAQATVNAEGATFRDRFQQPRMHPAVLVERDSRAAMVRNLTALGLDLEPLRDGPGRPPASERGR
jgi:P27 family predicted phage terminase small subunit